MEQATPTRPNRHSGGRRWLARLILAAVLLPWAGHFAWTRITARPAIESQLVQIGSSGATPHSQALVEACAALPVVAEVPPPPAPAGKLWAQIEVGHLSEDGFRIILPPPRKQEADEAADTAAEAAPLTPRAALLGEWTLHNRHNLAQIVRHLESPEMAAALDRVAESARGPHKLSVYFPGGASLYRQGGPEEQSQMRINDGFFWLLARGRYFLEAGRPVEACRDYAAALRIADSIARGPQEDAVQAGMSMRIAVVRELSTQIIDRRWPQPTLAMTAELLRADAFNPAEFWAELRQELLACWSARLDRWYTRDAKGDGFLVLNAARSGRAGSWINLFSPLYDGRGQVMSLLSRNLTACTGPWLAGHHTSPYYQPLTAPPELGNWAEPWRLLDAIRAAGLHTQEAVLLVALRRFEADHGRWPASLQALVPSYLDSVPIAFGEPWEYTNQDDRIWLGCSWHAPTDGREEDPDEWYLLNIDEVEETDERE